MTNDLVPLEQKWSSYAAEAVQEEPPSAGTFLSTRGGILSFDDEPLPGNQVAVIVLDSLRENTYFDEKFNPDSAQAPRCYAFGRGGDEMAPHISMADHLDYFAPQAETCSVCPHNAWGSADTGNGKACGERRRLTLLPAGMYVPRKGSRDFDLELFTDPHHFQTADTAFLKLPVTSVKAWAKYVTLLSAQYHRPPFGVVTRLSVEPDPKSQFKVVFEPVELVPDDFAEIIMGRHDTAISAPFTGYKPPEEREKVAGSGSLKGLRGAR